MTDLPDKTFFSIIQSRNRVELIERLEIHNISQLDIAEFYAILDMAEEHSH